MKNKRRKHTQSRTREKYSRPVGQLSDARPESIKKPQSVGPSKQEGSRKSQSEDSSGERYFLFVNRLLEILSLIILVVIPVFFLSNINSVFTIAKVSLLHFLVSLLVGIWLFHFFTVVPRPTFGSLVRDPLRLMTVILAAIYFLSTLTSVFPKMSFWGSYMRREGIYTVFSFIAFSLILSQTLRNRSLGRKMLFLLLIGSGLASIYGIYQHYWLDPLFKDPDLLKRIMSTSGNPLFFSIYLAMLIPFVVSTFVSIWGKPNMSSQKRYIYCGLLVFLVFLNFIGFWFSQSRGPILGLTVGMMVYLTLYSIWKKKIPLMVASGALFIGLLAVVVFLSVPGLAKDVKLPFKSRIISTDQLESAGAKSRFLMWEYSIRDLILKHPSIGFEQDKWNSLRPFLGYGPEGMDYAFPRVFRAELVPLVGRGVLVDRAHNRYIDMTVATGFLGVTALLVLIAFIFIRAWRWLKRSHVRENQFMALAVISTIVVWMVDGIFGINTVETALFFWSIVALVSASAYWEDTEIKKSRPRLMISEHIGGVFLAMVALFILIYTGIYFNLTALRADYQMRQGIEFSRVGQPNKAVEAFNRAATIQPRWSIYSNYLARTYFRVAQGITNPKEKKLLLEASSRALNNARAAEPLAYTNYTLSGYIYSYWAEQLDKSKWDEAIKFYETASTMAPYIPSVFDDWAMTLDKAGQNQKALEKLDYALSLENNFFQRHILKAIVLFNLRENEKALREIMTAVKINSNVLNQFSDWSTQLKNKGVVASLIPLLQKYVGENPQDWIGSQIMAIVYMDSEKYKEAIDEVNRGLALVPENQIKEVQPVVMNILNKKVPPDKR